jgi:hypothetical protein
MLRLASVLVGGALTVLVVARAQMTPTPQGVALRTVRSSSQMWPLCLAKGATRLHVIVDDVDYYVPNSDLWMMSKCAEGHVAWFTIDGVTKYSVLLSIRSRAEKFKPNFEREWAFAQMHATDPLTPEGLLRYPVYDSEQFSNFLGYSDDGTILVFACTDKKARPQQHYCHVLVGPNAAPKMDYWFDLSLLPEWKQVDRAVRSYALEIREAPS